MNPDGSAKKIFAKGLRNAVWIKWIGNNLFATNQGSDHLGLNRPDETFHALQEGGDYGWPGCHSSNGKLFRDTTVRSSTCKGVSGPYAFFPAHSSALGFDYFDLETEEPALTGAFVVALHGSTNKRLKKGYKVVIMRKGQKTQDLITGFLKGSTVYGRPCGVMRLSNNSFLLTDDHTGIVYLVRKKKG
jgi:glucose/arabinose dehydrogenase